MQYSKIGVSLPVDALPGLPRRWDMIAPRRAVKLTLRFEI